MQDDVSEFVERFLWENLLRKSILLTKALCCLEPVPVLKAFSFCLDGASRATRVDAQTGYLV